MYFSFFGENIQYRIESVPPCSFEDMTHCVNQTPPPLPPRKKPTTDPWISHIKKRTLRTS